MNFNQFKGILCLIVLAAAVICVVFDYQKAAIGFLNSGALLLLSLVAAIAGKIKL